MTKKQIKEEARRLVTDFQHQHFNCSMLVAKEMSKKTISEIQRVLVYFPAKDGYGCNWREYFKDVAAEIEKL